MPGFWVLNIAPLGFEKKGHNLLINGVYWGYNPLILTFDPNFLGHPSWDLPDDPVILGRSVSKSCPWLRHFAGMTTRGV